MSSNETESRIPSDAANDVTFPSPGSQSPGPLVKKRLLEPGKAVQWNTTHVGLRVAADLTSAATASLLIAPIISVIDRSIIEKAATGSSFSSCLLRALRPAVTRPHAYLVSKQFLLIFALYFSTYTAANTVDTISSTLSSKPAQTVTSGTSKFIATSGVNLSLCVYKDSQFAKMFGGPTSSPAAAIPKISYALFAIRDSLTIFASFNLPPLIAPQLANLPPGIKSNFSRILSTESGRTNTAQFLAPAAIQLISTPIHLHGLDLYNRQGRLGFSDRFSRIIRDWGVSAIARMGRIIPAFGVGGVVNTNMRRSLMTRIEGQ